eukprot:TRINITY_DN115215_c0_g1_i1.p1 TRINITY_DN115215_c0_g1~~TRINITY_DN115215_c0_g1_i1.p1  ORF type:complete len:397 (+),score=61.30 TRINITY_DN115215_c0_g1_i1:86-1276(+)
MRHASAGYRWFTAAAVPRCVLALASSAASSEHGRSHRSDLLRQEAENRSGVAVASSQVTPGLCASVPLMELTDCSLDGQITASTHQIETVEDCAKLVGETCPDNAKFVSFSPLDKSDACAWYRECSMQSLVEVEGGSWYTSESQPALEDGDEKDGLYGYDLPTCQRCMLPTISLLGAGTTNEVKINASSYWGNRPEFGYKAADAEDNGDMTQLLLANSTGGWCANDKDLQPSVKLDESLKQDSAPWLELEFPDVRVITEIITASHRTWDRFPRRFMLRYATKLHTMGDRIGEPDWTYYKFDAVNDDGKRVQSFSDGRGTAPATYGSSVSAMLIPPIEAKYLKFKHFESNFKTTALCLRLDVRGCSCRKKAPPMRLMLMPIEPAGEDAWVQLPPTGY